MKFRRHQEAADHRSLRLYAWFAMMLLALVMAVNGLLALVWRLVAPLADGYPALFFETNTAVIALFVLGGCWTETRRLRDGGGPRVAHWLGGREVAEAEDAAQRRLLNVVDEMALASGQPLPRVYLLHREDTINAFVAGWAPQDTVLCVTRGALERLDRSELQGLVAHEFGHIRSADLPLFMRLLALVWGLSLVHGFGRSLMEPGDDQRHSPLAWVVGAVLAAIGWLGWLAGRALQAAVSRQREFHADASAVQFTRSRDGLGQVLRKVWHDQQAHAARLHTPAAGLVASMLLHQPAQGCLATHPRLSERIRRLYGRLMPPLPAMPVRVDAEPRRPRPAVAADGRVLAAAPSATQADVHALALATPDDRDALDRLRRLAGPNEQRLAVLALMMDADNAREHKLWRKMAEGLPHSERILTDVRSLLPGRRVPEFERLTARMSGAPLDQRRAVVEAGRDLLRADGRVSPRDRLWWLSLRHRLNDRQREAPMLRPVTGQGQDLSQLPSDARHAVASLSVYLARILPEAEASPPTAQPDAGPTRSEPAQGWLMGVGQRLGKADIADLSSPDADRLMLALTSVQELSWMVRPLLVKAWVEEAVNHSPYGVMSQATADALRLMAGLIDAPLPPMLASHYPREAPERPEHSR